MSDNSGNRSPRLVAHAVEVLRVRLQEIFVPRFGRREAMLPSIPKSRFDWLVLKLVERVNGMVAPPVCHGARSTIPFHAHVRVASAGHAVRDRTNRQNQNVLAALRAHSRCAAFQSSPCNRVFLTLASREPILISRKNNGLPAATFPGPPLRWRDLRLQFQERRRRLLRRRNESDCRSA